MIGSIRIACRELTDRKDGALEDVRRLYKATIERAERVPWKWLKKALDTHDDRHKTTWIGHLIAASAGGPDDSGPVAGFAYGAYLREYGGYACYLGVAPEARGWGVGRQLLDYLVAVLRLDAAAIGAKLPFVVLESRAPAADAGLKAQRLWDARRRVFTKSGALWLAGAEVFSPNYLDPDKPTVPLKLFVIPVDEPAGAFDADRLRDVVGGLYRKVYGRRPGDPEWERTFRSAASFQLRPAIEAE